MDDIAYKKIENKEAAKMAAELFSQVETFFAAVQHVKDSHHGLLDDPKRVWNMDETAVDCNFGKLKRGFTASGKRSGGSYAVKSSYSA